MSVVFCTMAPWSLMLLLLLSTIAADKVITNSCRASAGLGFRTRHYPTDTDARILIADKCDLTHILEPYFNGLPYLHTIDLEQNSIFYINPATFKSVPRLMWLDLNRNHMTEPPVFDEDSCPSLTILDLRENYLSILNNPTALSECNKLQKLYLSKNNIEYIHPDLFSHFPELTHLQLHNNKIMFIPNSLLANNNKLERLELQNNKLSFLPDNLFTNNLKYIDVDNNPWHCSCFLELLADAKRAVVNYNYWIYNGLWTQCVFFGMYSCHRSAPSKLLAPTRITVETSSYEHKPSVLRYEDVLTNHNRGWGDKAGAETLNNNNL